MTLRTGIDLVDIERLAQLPPAILTRFRRRVLTAAEQAAVGESLARLAGRVAAKEAAAKALACGIGPVRWQELEVLAGPDGAPELHLHGAAAQLAARLGARGWSVSISHTRTTAAAVIVIDLEEWPEPGPPGAQP